MDIPDFIKESQQVFDPIKRANDGNEVRAWRSGASYGYQKGYSDCVEKEVKPLKDVIENRLDAMHRFDKAEKQWLERHDKDQEQIQQLKQEIERLKAAKP